MQRLDGSSGIRAGQLAGCQGHPELVLAGLRICSGDTAVQLDEAMTASVPPLLARFVAK